MVVASADFLGLTHSTRGILAAGLAFSSYAEEEGFEEDPGELQESLDAFRYRHDLLTAEETERWLDAWGVTLDDLTGYLSRRHWRERFAGGSADLVRDYAPGAGAINDSLWEEAVFDGAAGDYIIACARRSAAWVEAGGTLPPPEELEAVRGEFFARAELSGRTLPGWLSDLGRDETWFDRMLALEACASRTRDAALRAVDLERELAGKRMGLTRITLELAAFPTEEAAREAMLCVTEDCDTLAGVAGRAGAAISLESRFFDEYPNPIGRLCISALPGEVLGPIERNGRYELCGVVEKTEPEVRDERVRRFLEQKAVSSAFEHLINMHVVWLIEPGVIS
jgi:hypothetical protein